MNALREQPARLPASGRRLRARLAANPFPLAVRALLALTITSALAQEAQHLAPTCTYTTSTSSPPMASMGSLSPGPVGWDHLGHRAARRGLLQPHGDMGARRARALYLNTPPRSTASELLRDVAVTTFLFTAASIAALAPAWSALCLPPPRRTSRRQAVRTCRGQFSKWLN